MGKQKPNNEPPKEPEFKIRIKELRHVKASDLKANPLNWRTHPQQQRDALSGILSEIGYADALIARELEDGTLELIDGHLRADTTPDMEVPVLVTDLTEDEAHKVLLTLDPLAAMAGTNPQVLDALLRQVETQSQAVADMLAKLASDAELYEGSEINGTDHEETAGEFAEGDQFSTGHGAIVIPLEQSHPHAVDIKTDIQALCDKWGLTWRMKTL